ncbi:MAG: ABC transporter substrate-binding protein [Nitrososphaerales archaeon]|jgi:peptide/nickel transport system substrate-binding protein
MNISSYKRKAISTTAIVVVIIIVLVVAAVAAYYAVGGPSTTSSTTSSHSSSTSPTYKNKIIVGTTDTVQTTLDPADAYDYFGISMIQNLGDGLVDYRPGTSQYVPALATSWSVSPDGATWNFTLRQGVKFADGTAFNATAVKYSVDRQFAIQEAAGPFVGAGIGGTGAQCCGVINSTKVLGPYLIQFKLNQPFTSFLGMMAFATMYPVEPKLAPMPAHPHPGTNEGVINYTGNVATENPNQLGPYILSAWQRSAGKDVEIDLTANPNYWNASGGYPKTPNIVISFYSDSASLALAVKTGAVDIAYRQLAATDVQSDETNSALKVWTGPGTFIQYLVFNENVPAFQHQLVREAVAAAVNRTLIDNTVFLGQAEPLYSMIPNGMIYHTDAFQTDYGNANTAKAKSLLTQAGYSTTNKLIVNLTYPTGHYTSTDLISSALKQSLEATGMVTVNLLNQPWSSYKSSTANGQLQAYIYGWYPDYLDPYDYSFPFFPANGVGFLYTHWTNSTASDLLTQISGTSSSTQLTTMYTQLQNIVAQAAPVVPLFQGTSIAVSSPKVSGIVLDVTTNFRYWLLQETT